MSCLFSAIALLLRFTRFVSYVLVLDMWLNMLNYHVILEMLNPSLLLYIIFIVNMKGRHINLRRCFSFLCLSVTLEI